MDRYLPIVRPNPGGEDRPADYPGILRFGEKAMEANVKKELINREIQLDEAGDDSDGR